MRRYRPAEIALRKVTEKGDAFNERDFILQRGVGRIILQQFVEAGWIVAEPAALLGCPMYRLTEHGRAGLIAANP
jgi:hypothetical protein